MGPGRKGIPHPASGPAGDSAVMAALDDRGDFPYNFLST